MRVLPWLMLVSVGAAALVAACGDTINEGDLRGGPGTATPPPLTDPDGGDVTAMNDGLNTTGMGAGSGANTGLPCDVQQLLENRCIGCHLGPSPAALLTYADLMKMSTVDPSKTLAQESLVRMQSTTSPMPPAPAVAPTAAEIMTFQAWVSAGTPMGASCTTTPPGTDGGTTTTPTVCTSGVTKTGSEGSTMRPGEACITCHTMRGGPAFSIAGTVYPTAHEPNDCVGVMGGLTVVVTDKNGATINLPVNSVGNFQYSGAVAAPFHVKVTNGTTDRAMADSLTAGDCNSCHTVNGFNGAPGRIMAP